MPVAIAWCLKGLGRCVVHPGGGGGGQGQSTAVCSGLGVAAAAATVARTSVDSSSSYSSRTLKTDGRARSFFLEGEVSLQPLAFSLSGYHPPVAVTERWSRQLGVRELNNSTWAMFAVSAR